MVYMLDPIRFPPLLATYRLVCSHLVLGSSSGSGVQSQAPCVTFAVRFPWKPIVFCVARLGEDRAASSATSYRVFSSPFTFTPFLTSPTFLQEKVFLGSPSEAQPDTSRQEKLQFQNPCREKK